MIGHNRVALITGASRGIGRCTAKTLAKEGYRLVLGYNQSKDDALSLAAELENDFGAVSLAFKADVSDENQVRDMINHAVRQFGKIDLLVCCAGVAKQELFTDISSASWKEMMSVHVDGAFFCCKETVPHMIRQQSGKIIFVSSVWGMVGASCEVAYSTAKAALIGMCKSLAKELAPSQIEVNCVAPGVIDTAMNGGLSSEDKDMLNSEIPLGRFGTTEDVANLVAFLASDKANYITGQVISPNGGFVM